MTASRIDRATRSAMTFIRRLREKEEHVRRRWLFGLTALSMIIVVSAWIGFFNLTVPRASTPDQIAAASAPRAGIGTIFAAGVSVTAQELTDLAKRLLATIASPFQATTDITIERGAPQTFQVPSLPPVPPTSLP